jgi:adenosylcobinamide kinase/adenosylcobinamide-phosphate guanylyltransferase
MPPSEDEAVGGKSDMQIGHDAQAEERHVASLLEAIAQAQGPIVLVGNEIGLGVIPMGEQVRSFVDALGRLNQEVARVCERVTLMAAGLPLTLKDTPCVP